MCCGFNDTTEPMPSGMNHPSCDIVNVCLLSRNSKKWTLYSSVIMISIFFKREIDFSKEEINFFQLFSQAQCCNDPHNEACLDGVCKPCMEKLQSTINDAFKLCGGIGLFFSFTEVIKIIYKRKKYRNKSFI